MAYRRCDDCGQVYDLNSDYDHDCEQARARRMASEIKRPGEITDVGVDRLMRAIFYGDPPVKRGKP